MASDAAAQVKQAGNDAEGWIVLVARIGILAYGVVHLITAWLTGQIALGGGGGEASSTGALEQIAQESFGSVLLWVIVVGMAAMTLWQLLTAGFGDTWVDDDDRPKEQAKHVGKAIIYGYLAYAAFGVVSGSGSSGGGGGGGGSQEETLTAMLLGAPAGRFLVAAIGIGVAYVGYRQISRGLDEGFTEKLTKATESVRKLGKAGYVAKGITLILVGGLFGWAALTADADKAGGMDQALSTLAGNTLGTIVLVLIALGLAAYGVFCFAWSRYCRP